MQEPLSTTLLQESENKYPDCLLMKLTGIPVQSKSTDTEQFDLYLTLQFSEQWVPLLNGRVKLGIKGGELKLKLENGDILAADSLQFNACQIKTKSVQKHPVWRFEAETDEPVLKGLLDNAKLGTLNVISKPCRVEATFEVLTPDVNLTDAEGLWRHDISPNQHAVLERKLALFLWDAQLKPYLSWAQLCYESPVLRSSTVEKSAADIAASSLQQLQDSIHHINEAKTHDFLELVKIAGLNPMIDLAGGNLRGTTLNGVELSGANLSRANLRGADLSDADLSDANLSGAKLSGADLSGAYLENADLSHADLHRASLALANLIGANLNGANLIEANLSSANLSSANVKEARFGQNSGLSEEVKLNLKQRGAIVEDL